MSIEPIQTSNVKIRSDGSITTVEINGEEIPCISVKFVHVGGEVPIVILAVLPDEIEIQTTDTALVRTARLV